MTYFNDALRRGLDAAKTAQTNRNEIQEIFAQLNEDLRAMSDGKAEIAVVPRSSIMDGINRLIVMLDRREEEQVLAVRSIVHKDMQPKQIARWKEGDAGYPCSIIWGERNTTCDDSISLVSELAELVSSPLVGEAILNLMNSQAPDSTP